MTREDMTWPVSREDLEVLVKTAGLNEENAAKAMLVFEAAVATRVEQIEEELTARVETHIDKINEAIDAYTTHVVDELTEKIDDVVFDAGLPSIQEDISELRNLMLLAVSVIGGQEKSNEFIRKVSALARAGSLSSSSGDWASGAQDDSASNRASIAGGGVSLRKEDVEVTKQKAAEIFEDVSAGLNDDEVEEFHQLSDGLVLNENRFDAQRLRGQLTSIRNHNFADPGVRGPRTRTRSLGPSGKAETLCCSAEVPFSSYCAQGVGAL